MDLFEKASRLRIRFPTPAGQLTVEDLWDLPLRSKNSRRPNLNEVAKELFKKVQENEVDFVGTNEEVDEKAQTAFSIVKHIIQVRLQEQKAAEQKLESEQKKARIVELIAQKQDEALAQKSEEELRALIDSM